MGCKMAAAAVAALAGLATGPTFAASIHHVVSVPDWVKTEVHDFHLTVIFLAESPGDTFVNEPIDITFGTVYNNSLTATDNGTPTITDVEGKDMNADIGIMSREYTFNFEVGTYDSPLNAGDQLITNIDYTCSDPDGPTVIGVGSHLCATDRYRVTSVVFTDKDHIPITPIPGAGTLMVSAMGVVWGRKAWRRRARTQA